ncbi:hypothetical protein M8818_007136 [Zalaria obscura]|uniref:Uncharacterized protein n=1 Tax=Zalaria obscura TaxID=2024903 RepID=A0ACC3S561_9PEZI
MNGTTNGHFPHVPAAGVWAPAGIYRCSLPNTSNKTTNTVSKSLSSTKKPTHSTSKTNPNGTNTFPPPD